MGAQRNSTTLPTEEECQSKSTSRVELPRSPRMRLIEPQSSPLYLEANAKQQQYDTVDPQVAGSPPPVSPAQSMDLGNSALAVIADNALEISRDSTQLGRQLSPTQSLAMPNASIQTNPSQPTVLGKADDDGKSSRQPPGSAVQHNKSDETPQPATTHIDPPEFQPITAVQFAPPTRIESAPSQSMASVIDPHRRKPRIAPRAPAGASSQPTSHIATNRPGFGRALLASSPQAPRQHRQLSTPAQRQARGAHYVALAGWRAEVAVVVLLVLLSFTTFRMVHVFVFRRFRLIVPTTA